MARPKKTEPAVGPTPAEIIIYALDQLAEIDADRDRLNERRKGALAPLFDTLSLSKKAVAAFMQRRALAEEDRANFDRTFNQLCIVSEEPFQPDLFDALVHANLASTSANDEAGRLN